MTTSISLHRYDVQRASYLWSFWDAARWVFSSNPLRIRAANLRRQAKYPYMIHTIHFLVHLRTTNVILPHLSVLVKCFIQKTHTKVYFIFFCKKSPSKQSRIYKKQHTLCAETYFSYHPERSKKVGSADSQSTYTHSSPKAIGRYVHLAKSDQEKFLVSLFSKSERGQEGQSPRKNGAVLFANL